VTTPYRQQAEADVLDTAAALFARRGFAKTSVQDVADAVGLSKTGLLHHFPSKQALHDAVHAHIGALGEQVLAQVSGLPLGPQRDRLSVEVLVDVALRHPGMVAMMLAPVSDLAVDEEPDTEPGAVASAALAAFGVELPEGGPDASLSGPELERCTRVTGALAALAVLTLAARRSGAPTAWRPHVVATCLGALGHRPGVPTTAPDQEA